MSDAQDPRHASGERPWQRAPQACDAFADSGNRCRLPYGHSGSHVSAPFTPAGGSVTVVVNDPINPKHYKGDLVMRILEAFGLDEDFNLGNVIKYLLRQGEKAGLEDIKKARWYLERAIAKREGKLPEELK